MDRHISGDDDIIGSLRSLALDKVCYCLATGDSAVTKALFSRLSLSSSSSSSSSSSPSSADTGTSTADLASPVSWCCPPVGVGGSDGGSGSVGIPSSIGDAIMERAREMGCLTTEGTLHLLRWCTPRVLDLGGVSQTVTDSLLLRYLAKSCAELEDVRLSWCPHLLEVEALLLKIRKAGVGGQEDEACPLRSLDVSGNEHISDGIFKALAGRCPSLAALKVDACPLLTGSFLQRLAVGCPVLTTLSAEGSTGISDMAVSNFVMESQAVASGRLRSLRLGGCPIGALTAQSLLLRGACLRELNLDGCSGLGDGAARMVCRACPQLLDLSLLGCRALSCRGAWQCTQHPTVETLSITLNLLPGPDIVGPDERAGRASARERSAHGGGGGGGGCDVRGGGNRGSERSSNAVGVGDVEGGAGAATPHGGSSSGSAAGGSRPEQWACTCLNAERSTCEACRAPRDTDLLPSPPPPSPRTTSSPPPSPPPTASGSPSPSTSPRGGDGGGHRRSPGAAQRGASTEDSSLPLPAVPPKGPLKRMRLELAVASPEAIAAAAAAASASVMAAALAGVVSVRGGGDDREAGHARGQGQAEEQAQAREQEQEQEQARSRSRSHVDATGLGQGSGCALPLRRLAPLLPPGLEVLDVWSCNAPLTPPPPPPPISMSMARSVSSGATESASQAASRKGRWEFGSRGRGGGGGGGGGWRAAAGGDGEEAPAFDGAGPGGMWVGRQWAGTSGGGVGGSGAGAGGGGGDEGDLSAVCSAGAGVEVSAAPGDLISIAQACPALRELAIRGDPNQEVPVVPFGVRIRGRGADAHIVTAAACSHATAAAVLYFLRSWGSTSDSSGSGGCGGRHGMAKGGGGGGGGGGDGPDGCSVSGSSGSFGLSSPHKPGLRALTIVDCPTLPPLAVLEAVCAEGGAGLEHVAVGTSNPPPPPSPPPLPPGAAVSRRQRGGVSRDEELGEARAASTANRGIGGAPGLSRVGRAGWQGSKGEAEASAAAAVTTAAVGVGAAFACGWEDGALTLSSETLRGLSVAGEGALTRLVVTCPRLKRLEVVRCPSLGEIEVFARPALADVRVDECRLGNTTLVNLTKTCWGLQTLSVAGNASVGDPVFASALMECPRLRSLNMRGCRALGASASLLPLLRDAGGSLPRCTAAVPAPPPAPAPALAPPLPRLLVRLEELTVSHAPGFTGAHLAALSVALPSLRRLTVSHCRSLIELAFLPETQRRQRGRGGGGGAGGEGTCGKGAAAMSGGARGGGGGGGWAGGGGGSWVGGVESGRLPGGAGSHEEGSVACEKEGGVGVEGAGESDRSIGPGRHERGEENEERRLEEEEKERQGYFEVDGGEEDAALIGEGQRRASAAIAEGVGEGGGHLPGVGESLAPAKASGGDRSGVCKTDAAVDGSEDECSEHEGEELDSERPSSSSAGGAAATGAATEGLVGGGDGGRGQTAARISAETSEAGGRGEGEGRGKARRSGKGTGRRRAKSAAAAVEVSNDVVVSGVNPAGEEPGDHDGGHSSRHLRRATGKQKYEGGGGKLNRKARAAAKKNRSRPQDVMDETGGGGGGGIDGVGGGNSAEVRGGKGGGKIGSNEGQRGDAFGEEDGEDVFQGMEFRVDGKTREKLERLAAALPREPGKKQRGRPSCIRFLQEACPRSAAECPWAHLPMHPPKTLKFKPLVTLAQEPSKSSNKRAPPPLAAGAKSTAPVAPRSATAPTKSSAAAAATATATTVSAAAPRGDANSAASVAKAEVGIEEEFATMSVDTAAGFSGARCPAGSPPAAAGSGADGQADVCFKNLQFLEIHDCPGLKTLEGLRCPALAAARVTSCRQLTSLNLEAAILSHLNLTGCVRLGPWELQSSSGGSSSLSELQVAILNHCKDLPAKFLALLVNHARHLHRLEIYGAAVVAAPHGHGSTGKSKQSGGRRDISRVDFNRMQAKAIAILKGLDAGRPKLTVVRTKKEFLREQDGST